MSRVAPLSGFPEWTPEGRRVERHVIDTLRDEFELHGFAEVETRAVEPLDRLSDDSEASKEIYALRRLKADPEDGDSGLGLHFDLTVPFARYVEEFSGRLAFPFRRYQIQKVWRGERPQDGRFREFYQADIDIVGRDSLPARADAEVAVLMARALARLPIPGVTMRLNNRRIVESLYRGLGISDLNGTLRIVDKLPKIGPDGVSEVLAAAGLEARAISGVLSLAGVSGGEQAFAEGLREVEGEYGGDHEGLREGIDELTETLAVINAAVPGVAVADLSIARGLDYYTGTVVETFLEGHEDLGSISSGGRYDSLVAGGGFPGVGMSVGVSRLVGRILSAGLAAATRSVPSAVFVAVTDEDARPRSEAIADRLRARGIPAEVSSTAAKFGKQIQAADRRGIPFVWFPGDTGGDGQVKDIRSGDQAPADADAWAPPEQDLKPRVERL
ncbi:MAG: histidine--tRNA ligase [Demequinaceae bacterium]|nr:histidine--tRNA ligase [Demequinaceae bacterium]